jgi:acetyl esterase/lipase
MKTLLAILTYLSTLLGVVPFVRPQDRATKALLWLPKLLAGALSPILGIVGALGSILGLARRDWKLMGAGILSAGLAARFLQDLPGADEQFDAAFGPCWERRMPGARRSWSAGSRWSSAARLPGKVEFKRNVLFGSNPRSGEPLLADLWQPPSGTPRTGLGAIYAHGSGWRVGDKDMFTRYFFGRLAAQGHVVLDIAYTLWPQADIATMVSEVNQAILWMKQNGAAYGVDPEHIVAMGGSAGAHLALLAAYAPDQPAFRLFDGAGDTSVRGVVAFYPPVDLLVIQEQVDRDIPSTYRPVDKAANAVMNWMFALQGQDAAQEARPEIRFRDMMADMLGGQPEEIPEIFRQLSPIQYVGPHCPPTLLLQGSDDVFDLAPGVHCLQRALQEAGVPVVAVEFPHVEHGFDLILPRVSPTAQAAIYGVERFLALLV